jgi:hypothetical protein
MLKQKIGLIALLTGLTGCSLYASSTLTNFTSGDLVISFRGGSYDLVADAGPISNFLNATPGSPLSVMPYTTDQLAKAGYPSGSGSIWQGFAWQGNTIYITQPRSVSADTQTTPWLDQTATYQTLIAQRMATVVQGAAAIFKQHSSDTSGIFTNSTPTAVIEPNFSKTYTAGLSYNDAYLGGYGGQWDGNFQGNAENDNSAVQSTNVNVLARSDFYKLTPSNGSVTATYLGYFEYTTSGAMNYVAAPATVLSVPIITSITRAGTTTTIQYKTGISGSYNLYCCTLVTNAMSTWTNLVGSLSSGDTTTHSISLTDTNAMDFYLIKGQ